MSSDPIQRRVRNPVKNMLIKSYDELIFRYGILDKKIEPEFFANSNWYQLEENLGFVKYQPKSTSYLGIWIVPSIPS